MSRYLCSCMRGICGMKENCLNTRVGKRAVGLVSTIMVHVVMSMDCLRHGRDGLSVGTNLSCPTDTPCDLTKCV